MNMASYFLGLVFLLNMILASAIVFRERRDIGSTWAWLLVLYFIPVLGFIMYLLFAQNYRRIRLFEWKDIEQIGMKEAARDQLSWMKSGEARFRNPVAKLNMDLIRLHLSTNRAVLTEDNEVELLTDGEEKFIRLFRDIESARDHIHIQYYIIQNDKLGTKLIHALTEKAREGVSIRLLYDELGSRKVNKRFFKSFREAGGVAEAFFPSKFRLINFRLNYRNHRKLVIIDGSIGYTGGFNVGDEYLGLDPKFGYWRDTHLRVQGSAVHSMQTRFILDWNQASRRDIRYEPRFFPSPATEGTVGMQIVASGPESKFEHIKNGYVKMVASAKKSIYIQTPYFIPDASLLDSLRIAALSGVEVNILIPNKPDHPFVYWATLSFIGELLKAEVSMYLYNKGFVHAKTIVVDEEIAFVGTANMDVRSFKLNFEVGAFLYDTGISRQLTAAFKKDIEVSTLLTMEQYKQRSRWIRFKESVSRLVSPIL
ncbi:cardiolipin synthase [Cohnella cholangitidis]|uniref:Cardiolipin synthase n=1 Tax=Cohnella cholangitidis TaxID=2598458 RepID=A0A7G5BWZ2_9BACL|nr:cardiolipin synthase [Cohnella cholangitidis]QMV41476.1 cardiolipin synthase [Cohnella cholangitidis]